MKWYWFRIVVSDAALRMISFRFMGGRYLLVRILHNKKNAARSPGMIGEPDRLGELCLAAAPCPSQ